MTKPYPEYDIPKQSIKDRIFSQRPSALVIEGLLVLVAIVVTVGFLSPAAPVDDNRDEVIAELEAIVAAQEAALADATAAAGLLSASAIKDLAWSNLSNAEYRSAAAMYSILIAEGQADADVYAARGLAYSQLDEHALAVQDYTRFLELDPDNPGALNNRCWAYSEIGEYDLALADCNRLLSLLPEADFPFLNRGIVNEKIGAMDAALNDYAQWIIRHGSQAMTRENLAWMGSIEVSMDDGYVYFFPFHASAGQDVVVTATSVQRDVDADPLLFILDPDGQPLTANDDTGQWWDSYVSFQAPTSGQYTAVMTHAGGSAVGQVEVALDIAGDITIGSDIARYKREAFTALMSGDYQAAHDFFRQALSLNSRDAEAMNWAGVAHRYMGEYDAALSHISMAMRLDGDYALPYLSRGITYEMMGEAAASATDYYRYVFRNRSRSFYHSELEGDSQFELPMRDGWVYSIPFRATAGQTVDIDVETVAPGFVDPLIILFGPENQPLIGDDDISRNEYDASIDGFELPADGQYTLIVSHAEGGSNGTVSVDLDLEDPAASMSVYGHGGCRGNGR